MIAPFAARLVYYIHIWLNAMKTHTHTPRGRGSKKIDNGIFHCCFCLFVFVVLVLKDGDDVVDVVVVDPRNLL